MGSNLARHRKQLRLYDEDIKHIDKLRRRNESDTDVIRRCLRMMCEPQNQPLLGLPARSQELNSTHESETQVSRSEFSELVKLAKRNEQRLTLMQKLLLESL